MIAYAAFVFLGKRWIENKFSERMESYKHEQNKELEEVRYKINTLFNRITKIHEKEFEVLPRAWIVLQDAIVALTRFTSIVKECPDPDRMIPAELDEFLKNSFLLEFQKAELRTKTRKFEYYTECVFYHQMNEARKAIVDFHNYIQKNRIFLSTDLKSKLKDIDDLMWGAYVDMELGYEAKESKMKRDAWKKVRDEMEPIKNEIEELVQKRLHYGETQ